MAGNEVFVREVYDRWYTGFGNLFRVEMNRWWKTRTWWTQALIWTLVIDGLLMIIILSSEAGMPSEELASLYAVFGGFFTCFGVVIAMQSAIIGEKLSGTAEWVLSKPISRTSFILAKWFANTIGLFTTTMIIPGILTYFVFIFVAGKDYTLLNFTKGLGLILLFNLFWISLTVMLGTLFNRRGAVIGIPIALILGQQFILGLLAYISPKLIAWTPFALIMPNTTTTGESQVAMMITGGSLESLESVLTTLFASILFIVIAIWRFNREEF